MKHKIIKNPAQPYPLGLKSKEPRLRDWNKRGYPTPITRYTLEIKRTSITRLKREPNTSEPKPSAELEIKRTSITRLKHDTSSALSINTLFLKSKEPRLRDWNSSGSPVEHGLVWPWNQKNLDYEIETICSMLDMKQVARFLEIKRTSITRLKRAEDVIRYFDAGFLKSKEPRLRDWNNARRQNTDTFRDLPWNQKNLDYEIETTVQSRVAQHLPLLEIKRTSITRLKHVFVQSLSVQILFLEIKRTSITRLKHSAFKHRKSPCWYLKSKEPRLRDWNGVLRHLCFNGVVNLKSKEPRLRDWNPKMAKRFGLGNQSAWNQKNLDYEIETKTP